MEFNPFSLAGKTILITGATSGIGKATAIACAKSGATIVATGRNEERLNELITSLRDRQTMPIIADLTDEDQLKNLVAEIPPLDGAVLCAGINQTLPIVYLTRKKVDYIFETNFFSQIELLRLLIKKKVLKIGSSVVAISSIGGNATFTPGAAAYGASKAALLSWMKTAAKELAPRIRVNCVSPGQVNTPMNDNTEISTEQFEAYRNSIPMKRFGEVEEIANGVLYLLSDASSWVTGTDLVIDGGTTL